MCISLTFISLTVRFCWIRTTSLDPEQISLNLFSFAGDLLLAFSLSVLVGLLLGALVYVLLTWASRRRASARITSRSQKSPQACAPPSSQLGLYRSTFLSVYRQPSLEPVGQLGSKPHPEASTFRPPASKKKPPLDLEEDGRLNPSEEMLNSDSESLVPNKRHSFWLGGNGLKGFLPLNAPPAYDSALQPFAETST
ncbi:Myc target-like protein 1 [Oryzias melastigma]|uniref:Myc target-like protein 1 n=1 Tax=Oryzias melastigma TaxID=30732 RepID=A0A834C9M2_ORYME|nr:Myc target-like protein 1 [Oryzias melastigma]